MNDSIEENTELHRYPNSDRYSLQVGPMTAVFSGVDHTMIRGDFDLLDADGERVGYINRVWLNNEVMMALDEIAEGNELAPDEYIPPKENSASHPTALERNDE